MPGSPRLVDLVQSSIDELLDREATALAAIAPELGELHAVARSFLAGGKRFRALFCYWGWQSVAVWQAVARQVEPAGDAGR